MGVGIKLRFPSMNGIILPSGIELVTPIVGNPPPSVTPTKFVQWDDSGNSLLASGASFNLKNNVAASNAVIVQVLTSTADTITAVSGLGATWIPGKSAIVTGDAFIQSWVGMNCTGGTKAISVTTSAGATWSAQATEVTNVGFYSGGVAATATSAAVLLNLPIGIGSFGSVQAGGDDGAFTNPPSSPFVDYAGSGTIWNLSNGTDVAYQIATVGGAAKAFSWTQTSAAWGCVGATLSPVLPDNLVQWDDSGAAFLNSGTAWNMPNNFTVGNLLIVQVQLGNAANSVVSVTSPAVSGGLTKAIAGIGGGTDQEIWYGTVNTSGSHAITVNTSAGQYSAMAKEYSGYSNTLITASKASGVTGNPAITMTPTGNQLIVVQAAGNAVFTSDPGGSIVNYDQYGPSSSFWLQTLGNGIAYVKTSSPTVFSWGMSSNTWGCVGAIFS